MFLFLLLFLLYFLLLLLNCQASVKEVICKERKQKGKEFNLEISSLGPVLDARWHTTLQQALRD